MIEIRRDEGRQRYVVLADGETAFGLAFFEDTWEIYDPRVTDRQACPPLYLKPVFSPIRETAAQRKRCLERLEQRWQGDQVFRRLLDFVAIIIQRFYADWAATGETEGKLIRAGKGAKLCRLFLDFLDPQRNPDRAERFYATRLLLQRSYYHLLAILYEMEREVACGARDPRVPLYLEGWDLSREYRATLRRWHAVILEPKNGWLFRDVLGRDREDEMWSLLVRGASPARLHRFFCEPAGREFIDYLIGRWFLPRYDLRSAEALRCAVHGPGRDDEDWLVRKPGLGTQALSVSGVALGILFFAASLPLGLPAWVTASVPLVVSVVSLGLLVMAALLSLLRGPAWLRFTLPNLFTAVVVGYLPLLLADEPWEFAVRLSDAGPLKEPWWFYGSVTFLGFAVVVGLLAFIYLLSRVQAVGPPPGAARRRALHILLRGLSYSFLVGVVAVDVLGGRLFDLVQKMEPPDPDFVLRGPLMLVGSVGGMSGPIYPAVVWVFLWLALLAGVVIQVWWEEQEVTESW
jgi:hypothetical protein